MIRKNWTSMLVCLNVSGDDITIIKKREEAYKSILAAIINLPTFSRHDHLIKKSDTSRSSLTILGCVEYIMDPDELVNLIQSVTDYPRELMRIVQL